LSPTVLEWFDSLEPQQAGLAMQAAASSAAVAGAENENGPL